MIAAVSTTTWIQLAGILIALAAALAAWAGVKQARDATREVRDSEQETRLPLLLLSRANVGTEARGATVAVSIYNAGDVAVDVDLVVVGEDAYAKGPVGVVRPGETIYYGTGIHATEHSRAVAFARSRDGGRWVWDHNRNRKRFAGVNEVNPSYAEVFAAFYPGEDLERLKPAALLRGGGELLF